MLFSIIDLENRVGALYLSNVYNKQGKFEVLYQVNANDKVIFEGIIKELSDTLLGIKTKNRQKIFTAVEQGSG